jgi:predicted PurR-regulated permease PerM
MQFTPFEIAIIVFFAVFIIISIILTIKITTTLKSLNEVLVDLRKELIPNLKKLGTTLDMVNSELGGVDKIIDTVLNTTKRADNMTKFAQEMIFAPVSKIGGILAGLLKAVLRIREKE